MYENTTKKENVNTMGDIHLVFSIKKIVFFLLFFNFKNSCLQRLLVFYLLCLREKKKYRMGSIITCPCFETALNYKLLILDQKFEEFPCLVHTLSVTLTALQYKLQ